MRPQTLRVGQGYSATFTVQLRDDTPPNGLPIENRYDGTEPLALIVCDSAGVAVVLVGSTVAWLDATAGTITLHIDDSDTTEMEPGVYGLSIKLTVNGEPYEAYRAVLRIEPRAV